jgi:DNA mismatch repair protein MutS
VAALAGVPPKVITAARRYLHELERRSAATHAPTPQQELLLEVAPEPETHQALTALQELDPDSLTPREALDALYRLKGLTGQETGK